MSLKGTPPYRLTVMPLLSMGKRRLMAFLGVTATGTKIPPQPT